VFGRRRLPAAARRRLAKQERVIAWASTTEDTEAAVVVTPLGVWLPGRDERIGWHQVHKATWSGSRLTVVPSTPVADGDGYAVMVDDTPIVVGLADPDDVPHEIRKRVTKSVAVTEHHPVPAGGVRIVGRRVPGVNGLTWHVRYDDGTDASDPDVVATTAALVAELAAPDPSL
jgi:hypothetical protein